MSVKIRDATLNDASIVAEFNMKLALESEGKALDPERIVAGVRAILSDPGRGRYFLACDGDKIIGQLAITYEWSDWRNGWFWWFQSVYVRRAARRSGVFSALYEHVFQLAQERGDICGLRLYVDNDNHKAEATYAARGMAKAGYHVMEIDFRNTSQGAQS